MKPVIRVENLGKSYRIAHAGSPKERYKTLRDSLTGLASAPIRRLRSGGADTSTEEFWALKDVDFEVQPGEVVGIIGRNGAGKSTLLKVLSRITKPTTGQVTLNGRVGSLLEVGTGFHPELTGRENVYLNGSILGMSRRDIDKQFDQIVAFAEVEQFLDTPVKRYSSGMYVRLAFAVAAHLEPEILIVDEVLAVGDSAFQLKCIGKMSEVARSGRTVLLVSHNMASVSNLCTSALLLNRGRLVMTGTPEEVIRQYFLENRAASTGSVDLRERQRPAWATRRMTSVKVRGIGGSADGVSIPLGGGMEIEVEYNNSEYSPIRMPGMGLVINHAIFGTVGGINTRMSGFTPAGTQHERGVMTCRLPQLDLPQGRYSVDLWFADGAENLDQVEGAFSFDVEATDVYGTGVTPLGHLGVMFFRADWDHKPATNQ